MVFSVALFWPLFSGQSPSCGWCGSIIQVFRRCWSQHQQLAVDSQWTRWTDYFCELCEFSFLFILDRMDRFFVAQAAVDLQLTQLDNNWLKEVSASDVLTSLEFCGVFLYPVLCTRFLWKHWQSKPGQVILCSMGPTTNNNAKPHFPRSIHWKTFNLSLCDVKTQDYASFLFVIAVEFIFHCLVWIFSASEGNLYSFPLWMKDDPLKILKHTLRSETKSIIRFKSKLFIGAWNPLQCHHLIWVKDVINCFVKGISTQMYLCIT